MNRVTRHRRAGLSLVEVVIGLAICAVLLTATAVATNAAFDAYQMNQEQASLEHRARLAMHSMLAIIRDGSDHIPYTPARVTDFQGGLNVTDTGIDLETSDGKSMVYHYDATNKLLLVDVQGQPTRTVLNGVEQFQVKLEPMRSAINTKAGLSYDLLKRATLLVTIRSTAATSPGIESIGKQVVTISSAVAPRRNAW